MAADTFVTRLNEQIGHEFAAHQQYVAIAVHYDAETLPQLARFFYRQALEERDHAMMMVQYLIDADADVVVPGVSAPRPAFDDIVAPVALALDQERRVTEQINGSPPSPATPATTQRAVMQWFTKAAGGGGRDGRHPARGRALEDDPWRSRTSGARVRRQAGRVLARAARLAARSDLLDRAARTAASARRGTMLAIRSCATSASTTSPGAFAATSAASSSVHRHRRVLPAGADPTNPERALASPAPGSSRRAARQFARLGVLGPSISPVRDGGSPVTPSRAARLRPDPRRLRRSRPRSRPVACTRSRSATTAAGRTSRC